ncbi:MAG: hypothetical protein U0X41_02665 [Chitinophagales bacterium]
MEKKTLQQAPEKVYEQTIQRKYRNYKWLMYLTICGLSLMFLSLTAMYFMDHLGSKQPRIKILPIFYWNSLVLLASSLLAIIAEKHFANDNFSSYKTSLLLLLGLGLLFLSGQFIGWITLFTAGYHFTNHAAAYLYVISGIHALHIIGGLTFLAVFTFKSWKMLDNYAMSVVYFTDPIAKSQLKLFAIFWHFLGVLWLYLLFFFLVVG